MRELIKQYIDYILENTRGDCIKISMRKFCAWCQRKGIHVQRNGYGETFWKNIKNILKAKGYRIENTTIYRSVSKTSKAILYKKQKTLKIKRYVRV